jgi:hypothetical protein
VGVRGESSLVVSVVTGIATDREQTSYCEPSEWGGTMVCERIPPSLELSSKEVP